MGAQANVREDVARARGRRKRETKIAHPAVTRTRQKQAASPAPSKGRSLAPPKRRPSHLFEHVREVDSDEGETEFDTGGSKTEQHLR